MFLSLFFMPKSVFGAAARVFDLPTCLVEQFGAAHKAHTSTLYHAQTTENILRLASQGNFGEETLESLAELPEEWQIDLVIRALDPDYLNDMSHLAGLVGCIEKKSNVLTRLEWDRIIDIAWIQRDVFEKKGCGNLHLKIMTYLNDKSANALKTPSGDRLEWRT